MNNSLRRFVVHAPRKVVWRVIILIYLFLQFVLPIACSFSSSLSNAVSASALPLTVILVITVRKLRLKAQETVRVNASGNNLLEKWQEKDLNEVRVTKAYINLLDWQEFELFVGEVYRRGGYHVEQKGGRNPDGGIDLVLRSDSGRLLVQCKHWKVYQVGVKPVRELFGVMVSEGATGAILVTGGGFTQEAQSWAVGKPLFLVDGDQFIAQANQSQAGQPLPLLEAVHKARQGAVPACPVCSRRMQKRTARSGVNAGSEFWGCPAFPRCRGTRQLQ